MQEYEILVAGPIGPVVASCLPGFTTVAVPTATVLTGAVASPDDLLGVINLLTAHGLEPIDIRINAHHAAKNRAPVRKARLRVAVVKAPSVMSRSPGSPSDPARGVRAG